MKAWNAHTTFLLYSLITMILTPSYSPISLNMNTISQDGIPEQFWNCAEITIQPKSSLDPLTSNLAAQIIPTNQHSKTIIGYYASWQWYDRDKLASPVNMDFKKISRVK